MQTHPEWLMPKIHQLQSTPVKIAVGQAANDMVLTRVGHVPFQFQRPFTVKHPFAKGSTLEIAMDLNGKLWRTAQVQDLKLLRHTQNRLLNVCFSSAVMQR